MAATVLLFDLGDLRRKWGWFLALGHPPRCWCARLDTAVRVILHGHRPVPLDCRDQAEVSRLGLGGFRRRGYTLTRNPALGRLALVGILVPRLVNRNCAAAAWLVARDDCSSASQLAGSAQRVAPRRVNSPCPEPQSITP